MAQTNPRIPTKQQVLDAAAKVEGLRLAHMSSAAMNVDINKPLAEQIEQGAKHRLLYSSLLEAQKEYQIIFDQWYKGGQP